MTTSTTLMDPTESVETIPEATGASPDPVIRSIPTVPRSSTAHVAPAGRAQAVRIVAPSRFDVHAVAGFEQWVTEQTTGGERDLVLDCSRIDFVDVAAVEAIERARDDRRLELTNLSVAALVTFRLLDIDLETPELSELSELAVAA